MQLKKESEHNKNTSIEITVLPNEIKQLITGPEFWVKAKTNRYLKLWREGHNGTLLRLAAESRNKNNPANWFARAASKAMWDRTLDYFHKLDEVIRKAAQVAEKLGTPVTKFIYKQVWKGVNVIRYAALAAETGRNKPKYFAWLCKNGETLGV